MRGIDILVAQDAGLRGASDSEQLSFATTNGRVLGSNLSFAFGTMPGWNFATAVASEYSSSRVCLFSTR